MNERTMIVQIFLDLPVRMTDTTEIKKVFPVLGYIFRIAADYQVSRMPIQEYHLPGETPGKADIVGIEAGYINPSCSLQSYIQRLGNPFILLYQQADTAILEAADDVKGVIGRAIVHDQQFAIRKRLSQHGADRFGNILSCVVGRHQDGDFRVKWHHSNQGLRSPAPETQIYPITLKTRTTLRPTVAQTSTP